MFPPEPKMSIKMSKSMQDKTLKLAKLAILANFDECFCNVKIQNFFKFGVFREGKCMVYPPLKRYFKVIIMNKIYNSIILQNGKPTR